MKISVIIPVYNGEKYLRDCLESIIRQDFSDYEVIVVDDGSTDNSVKIARGYGRVICSSHQGAGAARNSGAKKAKGEILAFTDSDVKVPPFWLKRIWRNFQNPQVMVMGGGYAGSLEKAPISHFNHWELVWRRRNLAGKVKTAVGNNLAVRKKEFLTAGGFPEDFKGASAEDLILSFKLGGKGRVIWDDKNSVWHHFKPTLKSYLRQQFIFARDGVLAYLQYPKMLEAPSHLGFAPWLQPLLGIIFFISLAIALFVPWIMLIFLGVIILTNLLFLRFLFIKEGFVFTIKSLGYIIMRDLIWGIGMVVGVWSGLKLILNFIRNPR